MNMTENRLYFASDYMEGAHPNILDRLLETNYLHSTGYGLDEYTASAADRIREACKCPHAEVKLLVGGTQTNAIVIRAVLRSYQGVIAPESGHIAVHEAGAVELGGHKVLALPSDKGKITAGQVKTYIEDYRRDENNEHIVMPGMVYISQPTEYGTVYSRKELEDLSAVCRGCGIPLYMDGARLAYALAVEDTDLSLPDYARLCDVFYIGGTKCGALFGEAVVVPDPGYIPHFFSIIKQNGALLAKGRVLGIQFDELFRDDLYMQIGRKAVHYAAKIGKALKENGYPLFLESPTNQIFVIMENDFLEDFRHKVEYSFIEKYDETHTVIRFATSWATRKEEVEGLIRLLER